MLEKKLRRLFDFQKFDAEPALQGVIDDVLSRYDDAMALNDNDLEMVAAAGTPVMPEKKSLFQKDTQ